MSATKYGTAGQEIGHGTIPHEQQQNERRGNATDEGSLGHQGANDATVSVNPLHGGEHMAFPFAHTFLHGDRHCLHCSDGGIGGAPRGDRKMGDTEHDREERVQFHEAHIGKRKADAPKVSGEPHISISANR